MREGASVPPVGSFISNMPKLYLFNPGHEEALRAPRHQAYTPPKVVRQMMYDLYELTYLLAERGDYVLRPRSIELSDFCLYDYQGREVEPNSLGTTALELEMWALEPFVQELVLAWGRRCGLRLSYQIISETYYQLSHRSTARLLLDHLEAYYPIPRWLFPRWLNGSEAPEEVRTWLSELEGEGVLPSGVMLKRPFTSSGRGVMALPTRQVYQEAESLLGQARRGQGISLEPRLEVVGNYALLFYLSGGKATHRYISTFATDPKGGTAYTGNLLLPQDIQRNNLSSLLPQAVSWEQWLTGYRSFLETHIAPHYSGWVGVDLFTYTDSQGGLSLHPCVEINLRCTMGVLAARASEILGSAAGAGARFVIQPPGGGSPKFSAYVTRGAQEEPSSDDISRRTSIFALHRSRL